MKLADFHYELPPELIARHPTEQRRGSRLLCLDGQSGSVEHRQFPDLLELLRPGDLLVFNDTRVIPARLFGRKSTGGQVEILIERLLSDREVLAQVRASKSPKAGSGIELCRTAGGEPLGCRLSVLGREHDLFRLRFAGEEPVLDLLQRFGHVPLPPYIDRQDSAQDEERYQTVYARRPGAVAAPTAGLHFDRELLDALQAHGVESAFVTLHVGAGTFQPVRSENIREHRMHAERVEVTAEVCERLRQTREAGGRIVAVGTTSVRCLETASLGGEMAPFEGETDIFIYPGYRFRVVDALITNFHLPESTLLMLVSAFAGRDPILSAYQQAVAEAYRFFSYGDAMFIWPRADSQHGCGMSATDAQGESG